MNLNPQQSEAAKRTQGNMMILAGAGTGKTATITERYGELLKQGVREREILMVTFTRKAANEMKSRIKKKNPGLDLNKTWIETFHRICMRILREDGYIIGVNEDFKICNEYQTKLILKNLIVQFGFNQNNEDTEEVVKEQTLATIISTCKTMLFHPESFSTRKPYFTNTDWEATMQYFRDIKEEEPHVLSALVKVYPAYQKQLDMQNLVDLDDLIFKCVELFHRYPLVLKKYQKEFSHIIVDEFQDTNYIQDYLLQQLTGNDEKLCIVGDDFQSIYAFRGSNINNILLFHERYKNVQTYKLEQNYRSTQRIIEFSNEIIKGNKNQTEKKLFTENPVGEKIIITETKTERDEAESVLQRIQSLMETAGYSYQDFTILYRNNSQSNAYAKLFSENGIPFQILDGTDFLEKAEIRDMFAYLKYIENENDIASVKRILNKPKRGIGKTSLDYIFGNGRMHPFQLENFVHDTNLNAKARKGIETFVNMIQNCRTILQEEGIGKTLEFLLQETDYEESVSKGTLSWQKETLSQNLDEFIKMAKTIEEEQGKMAIQPFYDALDAMYHQFDDTDEKVSLVTIHKAKGLEFPVVFIIGMDDATFPDESKINEPFEMEEERRVFYVAITRAKERLFLSYPTQRIKKVDGKMEELEVKPSVFIEESLQSSHVEKAPF